MAILNSMAVLHQLRLSLLDPKKVDLTWMILFDDLLLGTGFDLESRGRPVAPYTQRVFTRAVWSVASCFSWLHT